MIGKVGRVTGRVGPGLVGEIMVSVRGGSEAFYAHPQRPDEEIEPGFQAARRLSLDTRGTSLQVSCVTKQGIPVAVRGVVIYKVGDDFVSIANAARRFLDQQNTVNDTIHELTCARSAAGSRSRT